MKYLFLLILFFFLSVGKVLAVSPTPTQSVTIIDSFTLVNGEVRHIRSNGELNVLLENGNRVFIGGNFTQINGQPRKYVAAFSKISGDLDPWKATIEEPVKDIYIDTAAIYFSREKNPTKDTLLNIFSYDPVDDSFTYYARPTPVPLAGTYTSPEATISSLMVDNKELGFKIPALSDLLTFIIRAFFFIGGLAALFYLLQGALFWVTSGGDKDKIDQARAEITATVVGLIITVSVLAVVVTLEQIVFAKKLCFGISCPASIPRLVEPL